MKNRPILIDAIRALKEDASVSTRGNEIIWNDGNPTNITREQIDIKLKEMQSEYDLSLPLELLREKRDILLRETDWTQNRDVTLSNDSNWQTYRQSLRDLPSIASPKLDDNDQLSNVTWPTKPE